MTKSMRDLLELWVTTVKYNPKIGAAETRLDMKHARVKFVESNRWSSPVHYQNTILNYPTRIDTGEGI